MSIIAVLNGENIVCITDITYHVFVPEIMKLILFDETYNNG